MTKAHLPDILIETARIADAPAFAEIYAHHVLHGTATFETDPPDGAEFEARMARIASADFPWLAARDSKGAVLGYAYAGPFHGRCAYRLTCEDSIYLRHDALGRGIGTALLAELVRICEERGLRQMIAAIAGSEPASLALHQRFGFVETGRLSSVGRKHGQWLDVVYLQRALGVGDGLPPVEEPG